MVTRGIREFVARDWQTARAHKDAYWAERIARLGPLEALRVADELRRQVRQCDPTSFAVPVQPDALETADGARDGHAYSASPSL